MAIRRLRIDVAPSALSDGVRFRHRVFDHVDVLGRGVDEQPAEAFRVLAYPLNGAGEALVSVLEAPAIVAGLDDVAGVREPVEQRGGHLGIGKDGGPLGKGQVGGDDDRGALVKAADQVEQQLAAGLGERQVAELVEDDEVDTGEAVGDAALAANLDLGLELVDEVDDVEEAGFPPGSDAS